MLRQIQMADFYRTQASMFGVFGIWPRNEKKLNLFLIFQEWITCYFISFFFLFSLSVDMYLRATNSIEQLADASYYFTTQLSYILKLLCFRFKYKQFSHLLTADLKLLSDDKYTCKPWMGISSFVARNFLVLCYITSVFYCIWPFLDETSLLPVGGWFPWDVEGSIAGTSAAYIFQVLGILVGVTVNANLDTFVISSLMAACWQVSLLKANLSRITREQHPRMINKQLIASIEHHLAIIRYVELVEEVFGNGLFFQFISSGCALCITGFQIIIIPLGSGKFFTMITYLAALAVQIFAYCWAGQQLITESNEIGTSCYNMNWWYGCHCTKKTKTALFLMMERCKKPLSLRAGRFFTLSVSTLASIFRTSYSSFAVLQRVYTNKNM